MRLIAILLLALSAGLALAQDDLVPLPVPAGSVEFTGTWSYMTFDHQNSGPCPPGKPMSGTLSIAGTSDAATVTLLSGAVCSPASMCAFDGEITGNDLVVSTSAIVDDEVVSQRKVAELVSQSGRWVVTEQVGPQEWADGEGCRR